MIGEHVTVVDSARATGSQVREFLHSRNLARPSGAGGGLVGLLVTDMPHRFREVASRFLGGDVGEVEQVDL
jgi:glutamate racemase